LFDVERSTQMLQLIFQESDKCFTVSSL